VSDGAAPPPLRRRLAPAVAALVLAGACRSPPDRSALDADQARDFVREQARAVRDLSAAVSLSIEADGFEGSLSGALLIEPPSRLRLRASKLLQDVFDLLVTPDSLELVWFKDGSHYRRRFARGAAGTLEASASWSAAPGGTEGGGGPEPFLARLDGRALRLALSGFELPGRDAAGDLPPSDRVVEAAWAREGRHFVVRERLAGGERLERRFDGRSLLLEQVTLAAPDGAPRLRARYDDPEPAGGLWLPSEMELEDLAAGVRFSMSFDGVAVNEGVLPGAFTLRPPPGAPVREL